MRKMDLVYFHRCDKSNNVTSVRLRGNFVHEYHESTNFYKTVTNAASLRTSVERDSCSVRIQTTL